MKVKLLGPFKDLANTYDIEVDCVDLEDLIRKLIEKYGRPFEGMLRMKKLKFRHVYRMKEGIRGWKDHGFETQVTNFFSSFNSD